MFRTARNPAILPEFARQHSIVIDADESIDPSRIFPGVHLPFALAAAVRKRRLEFLAGRHCARQALGSIDPARSFGPLAVGYDRAPLWPDGIAGSITHTAGFVSSAVASTKDAVSLGIDTEAIILEQHPPISAYIARPEELAELVRSGLGEAAALTLVFSAKESVFKCLYPMVRRYFDYLDVNIRIASTGSPFPQRGSFRASLTQTISAAFPSGTHLSGCFEVGERYVHTGVAWS